LNSCLQICSFIPRQLQPLLQPVLSQAALEQLSFRGKPNDYPQRAFQVSQHVSRILKHIFESPQHAFDVSRHVSEGSQHVLRVPRRVFESPRHVSETPQHAFRALRHVAECPLHVFENPLHVAGNALHVSHVSSDVAEGALLAAKCASRLAGDAPNAKEAPPRVAEDRRSVAGKNEWSPGAGAASDYGVSLNGNRGRLPPIRLHFPHRSPP